jgi:histidine triad (HIT) family protein
MEEVMTDCIFCKIIAWDIPSTRVYTDETTFAFRDINPVAPTHVLIIPKKHVGSVNDLTPEDEALVGHLFTTAKKIAEDEGIADTGYRLIINCGPYGGQVVYHLHLHLIGGQRMRHPMG